jgi:glycosyltransferase involved in cell wall biosynthesis
VYNEAATLLSVLDPVSSRVDHVLVVDDGSVDGSLDLARGWTSSRPGAAVLRLHDNRGMSAALREGFIHLAARLSAGELGPDDLLFTLDADGQHDPDEIPALGDYMRRNGLDVALTRRDFRLYPRHKRLGNDLMSLWGSAWSGFRYRDVESGFRGMRLRVLAPLLDYYTGYRYSCAQEIAVLTARLGFRVDNDFRTVIRLYRSQTGVRDVAVNAGLGFWAFARWALRRKVPVRTPLATATSEHP